jgi:hypothetical protein
MNTVDKIQALLDNKGTSVEIGRSFFSGSKGWLAIEDKGDYFSIMYTSDKDTHSPLAGPALMLDLDKETGTRRQAAGLSGAWRSALSMWPVRDAGEIESVQKKMTALIDAAYEHNDSPHVLVPPAHSKNGTQAARKPAR